MKTRAITDIETEFAQTLASVDQLQEKARSEDGLTPEETENLASGVAKLEELEEEKKRSASLERLAALHDRQQQPVRQPPRYTPVARPEAPITAGEAIGSWLRSFGPDADRSPENAYRLRQAGIEMGYSAIRIPVEYDSINRKNRSKNRTVLTTVGVGSGKELIWQSYSSKVTEYLTYFSPILGLVASETTADGNSRTYFKIDDTSMISTYLSASGGTEDNPTIPDTNLATASQVINAFAITSGFQKVSFQELRDSYISLEDKIARATSNSHARLMEKDVVTGTGDGVTAIQGIAAAATALDNVAAWSQDAVEDAVFSIPPQYRANVILLSNDATKSAIRKELRDATDRTLFDKTVEDSLEYDTLFGKKYVVSQYCADDTLYVFAPEFYQLRLVSGQLMQQFVERFWPHAAFASIMTFGGAWLGPSDACVSLTLGS